MKNFLPLIVVAMLAVSCSNAQQLKPRPELSGDVETDIVNLLPEGRIQVDVMDNIKSNPRQEELNRRLQEAIQQNYEWFIEYRKSIPHGEPLPYHPNFGLTKKEYEEFQSNLKNVEAISSGTDVITIDHINNAIEFDARGKLHWVDEITIDLEKYIITVGPYTLTLTDTVNVTDENNALKSRWSGYSWRFEVPQNMNLDQLKELSSLTAKQYKVTIGRLEKNGKTFFNIEGREVVKGEYKIKFTLPLLF